MFVCLKVRGCTSGTGEQSAVFCGDCRLHLGKVTDYSYVALSKCYSLPDRNETADFASTDSAMQVCAGVGSLKTCEA